MKTKRAFSYFPGGFTVGVTMMAVALWMAASPPVVVGQAPTVRVFTTRAIRTLLDRVGQEFERSSRHRLEITTAIAAPMVRRVRGGEPFDVLVAAPEHIDALVTDGFILSESPGFPGQSSGARRHAIAGHGADGRHQALTARARRGGAEHGAVLELGKGKVALFLTKGSRKYR
ncbi:MAG: substrate-binding domain-containing protein [Acidobacteriota bacterium]